MNVLEKILEEIEKRVNSRKKLVRYEKKMGTITDVARNQGALEELVVIANIIDSYVNKVNDDWIPCSERMPEKNVKELYDMQLVTLKDGEVCLGVYRNEDDEWWTRKQEGERVYTNTHEVIAWKPLPEPYRAADSKPDWKENMLNTFLAGHQD